MSSYVLAKVESLITISIMTEESMQKKVLGNEKNIKGLVGRTEKMDNKLRRISEEIESLQKENKALKKELNALKGFSATFS